MPHNQPTLGVTAPDQHRFELIHVAPKAPSWRLLMVPAMGISARHYIDFAQALTTQNAEVFVHEWRGLGSSTHRASREVDWGYRELLLDLEASLAVIQAQSTAANETPLVVAGHSLGAQLGLLFAATHPRTPLPAVCIASGAPYFKAFPQPMRWGLRVLFRLMPQLAEWVGHYPGQRLGFAKRESRSVMRDWAMSGRTGRYQPAGVDTNLEAALEHHTAPILGIRMENDWFVPPGSLQYLLDKCPNAPTQTRMIEASGLGGRADHYRWMRQPETTAQAIGEWVSVCVLG